MPPFKSSKVLTVSYLKEAMTTCIINHIMSLDIMGHIIKLHSTYDSTLTPL